MQCGRQCVPRCCCESVELILLHVQMNLAIPLEVAAVPKDLPVIEVHLDSIDAEMESEANVDDLATLLGECTVHSHYKDAVEALASQLFTGCSIRNKCG